MAKPNKDGYYRRAFTFNGRQYRAVGKTEELMLMAMAEKKAALKRGENQIDAAMTQDIYTHYTHVRKAQICRVQTSSTQSYSQSATVYFLCS